MDHLVGSIVAGHRVQRVLGRGGMGVVYEATDIDLERAVALKVVAPELAGDGGFRERFIAESRLAASLDHPNVLPVFRAGEDAGVLFLAMRLVAGEDLRTLVNRAGPLPPARAVAVLTQVAAALDAAHARRLVHRDVKPANVLMAGDHAYLTDFGLAKDLAATAGGTASRELLGTLDYVAPERIRGGELGPWTDVYSLGGLLFFLLAGRVVFPLDTAERKLWAHVSEPPPRVSELVAGVPPELDDVLARALAKAPQERHASASAFATAVSAACAPSLAAGPVEPDRLRELRTLVAELPDEEVARRLAEIRRGPAAGRAERHAAFARRLAERHRAQAELEALEGTA